MKFEETTSEDFTHIKITLKDNKQFQYDKDTFDIMYPIGKYRYMFLAKCKDYKYLKETK